MRSSLFVLISCCLLATVFGQFPAYYEATALSGANELPTPNNSTATGYGFLVLAADQTSVAVTLEQNTVVSPTLGHVHVISTGTTGPAYFNFTTSLPTFNALNFVAADRLAVNTTFTEFLNALVAGNTYLNIHSATYPAGEIRGNLVLSTNFFTTTLSTANEAIPCIGTFALGQASAFYNSFNNTVTYNINANISSLTLIHHHVGPPLSNGSVAINLTNFGPLPMNNFVLDLNTATFLNNVTLASFISNLQAGNTYINLHSTTCPTGEARGQLTVQPTPVIGGTTTTTGSATTTTGSGATTTTGSGSSVFSSSASALSSFVSVFM